MQCRLFLFIIILLISAYGCKESPKYPGESIQGIITYRVYYPDSAQYGPKALFFPKEITLVFKGEKATFIASAGLGMIQMVNLMDHKEKKAVSLLIDNLRTNVGCRLTPDEIRSNENSVDYHIENTEETKTIAGFLCRKSIVRDGAGKPVFDIYYCDKIRFHYWNSPFVRMDRLFLEYTHTIHNLTMKLVATKVDLTTPVDTTLFEVKGNFKWMNQNDFFTYLSTF